MLNQTTNPQAITPEIDAIAQDQRTGFGGGAAWVAQLGKPSLGYASLYDSTTVGLLSARIGGMVRTGHLSVVAYAEPGLLVPAVSLMADDQTLAELGRPWFSALLGLGFSP